LEYEKSVLSKARSCDYELIVYWEALGYSTILVFFHSSLSLRPNYI